MPVDVTSLKATLELDDRKFQQGIKEDAQALSSFQRAAKDAAVSSKELDRALNSNAAYGKQLTETQKQQITYVRELTRERNRLALQMGGEGKIAQDLGVRFNKLSNEQRAILQGVKEATKAWEDEQKALAAAAREAERAANAIPKLTDAERQQIALTKELAAEKAKLAAKLDGESKQAQAVAGKYNLLTAEQRAELVATKEQSAALDQQQGSQSGIIAGLGKMYLAHMALRFAIREVADGFKFVLASGTEFIDAMNKIKVTTGATGAEFNSLRASTERVNKQVPNDLQDVAQAVATVHQRTGQVGPGLEKLSVQMLNLGRIAGGDLGDKLRLSTRTFGDWGIAIKNQGPALDQLFKATQRTGIDFNLLNQELVRYGAPLRELGFSFTQSAAMMALFDKEGVESRLVLSALRISLARLAKEGVPDAGQAFNQMVTEIKNAKSSSEATAIAVKDFGAKAGPDLAAAIREGKFEVAALVKEIQNSKDAINQTADQVDPLSKSLQELSKAAKEAFEPLGVRLVGAIQAFTKGLKTDAFKENVNAFVLGMDILRTKADRLKDSLVSAAFRLGQLVNRAGQYIAENDPIFGSATAGKPPPRPNPILEGSGADAAEFAVDFKRQRVRRENQAFAEATSALDLAPNPAAGGKPKHIASPEELSDIRALRESIARAKEELRTYNVTVFRTTTSVSQLTPELRRQYAEHLNAPKALRLENVALLEQLALLEKHNKAREDARKKQDDLNQAARDEIKRLNAQTRQLRETGKVRGEETLAEKLSGASPELQAEAKRAEQRRDAAQKEATAYQHVADVLHKVKAERDALTAAIAGGDNTGKAKPIEQEFPGYSPEILRTRDEVAQLRAIRAAQASAAKDKEEEDKRNAAQLARIRQFTADLRAEELQNLHVDELDQVSLKLTGQLYRDLQKDITAAGQARRESVDDAFNQKQRTDASGQIKILSAALAEQEAIQLKLGKEDDHERVAKDLLHVSYDSLTGSVQAYVDRVADAQARTQQMKDAEAEHKQLLADQAQGFRSLQNEVNKQAKEYLRLSGATKETILDVVGFNDKIDEADPKVQALIKQLRAWYKANADLRESQKFIHQFTQGFESQISNMFTHLAEHGFKGFFKSVVDGFKQMLAQIAAAYLSSKLTDLILGKANESGQRSGGGLGGLLTQIFGIGLGAIGGGGGGGGSAATTSSYGADYTGSYAGRFASGGGIGAGQWALVGERGPELFRPRQSGTIIPNHQLAGAGGVHISMTVVTPDAGSFRRNQDQIHADLYRAAQRMTRRNGG